MAHGRAQSGRLDREDSLRRPRSLAAFGAALRRRRRELALTLDNLMAKTGISKPYLSNIETGRAPGPASEEKLRRIARALAVSEAAVMAGADWLRTPASVRRIVQRKNSEKILPRRADGAIDLDAVLQEENSQPTPLSQANVPAVPGVPGEAIVLRHVPLINRVAAGHASEYTDLDYPRGIADQYVLAPDLPEAPTGSAFALKVIGDSMAPEYIEGEILIVAPPAANVAAFEDGEDCVVRLDEENNFATTFKRLFFMRDAEGNATALRLVPLNPAYPERTVAIEKVSGIYSILWRMKPGRRAAAGS